MPDVALEWTPSQSEALDGIRHAFFMALARDASHVFSAGGAVVVFVLLALLARWVGSETRRGRTAPAAFRSPHQAAVSENGQRAWVRVPAHVPMAVQHADAHHRFFYEHVVTHDVSAGALSFLSTAPPAAGLPLHFTLDLGEKWPLSLRGVVTRTERARPDAPSLVVVSLGQITPAEREHLARWVAREETREIEQARGGRLCARCRRPMADDKGEVHLSCTTATTDRRAHVRTG
jgi:hypothetical protein